MIGPVRDPPTFLILKRRTSEPSTTGHARVKAEEQGTLIPSNGGEPSDPDRRGEVGVRRPLLLRVPARCPTRDA
jgi:hypothetical protein